MIRTPAPLDAVRADLAAERAALGALLAGLDDAAWHRATPSPGWDVTDQIGHLAYFDTTAALAITEPDAFQVHLVELIAGATDVGIDAFTLRRARAMTPAELLASWRSSGDALDAAAATIEEGQRVAWYGPTMSASSFVTARLMETWAHGTDVADALDVDYPATARLRHIVRLGFLTRRWSYAVRGEEPPVGEVHVDVVGPDGERWSWGDANAEDTISGPALDFCLVTTQRRHLDDTALVTGELGRHWLERAQAFAGSPSEGPPPGGRRGTD